jgi:hypothetical protein
MTPPEVRRNISANALSGDESTDLAASEHNGQADRSHNCLKLPVFIFIITAEARLYCRGSTYKAHGLQQEHLNRL